MQHAQEYNFLAYATCQARLRHRWSDIKKQLWIALHHRLLTQHCCVSHSTSNMYGYDWSTKHEISCYFASWSTLCHTTMLYRESCEVKESRDVQGDSLVRKRGGGDIACRHDIVLPFRSSGFPVSQNLEGLHTPKLSKRVPNLFLGYLAMPKEEQSQCIHCHQEIGAMRVGNSVLESTNQLTFLAWTHAC